MKRRSAIAIALLALAMGGAQAQAYPNQPLKLIVPYPAGGGADVVARLVAQAAGTTLGQPVVVENKPGAGTIVGADILARSKPDGYTLMLADSSTMSTNPFLYKKLPYSPERDLMPVTLMTHYPFLLVSRNGFPAKTVSHGGQGNWNLPFTGTWLIKQCRDPVVRIDLIAQFADAIGRVGMQDISPHYAWLGIYNCSRITLQKNF
ncbi:MAG: tripartite tricarboxylate transporter substrate-binding protein, partial [Burkholderiaceae bacterium]|nr:tripartite tricarboxylate transporter substrate-binding protein [Burkholderiaceae bacterium]